MASEASIAGIRDFGMGWDKIRIVNLAAEAKIIGDADDDIDADDIDVTKLLSSCSSITRIVKQFILTIKAQRVQTLKYKALVEALEANDSVEWFADIDEDFEVMDHYDDEEEFLNAIRYNMEELYDIFDYYRILVN